MIDKRLLTVLAAALPVAGSLASISANEIGAIGATEWRIPITGYDPRDPLRGRYVMFRYAWRVEGDRGLCKTGDDCRLCLEDGGGRVQIEPPGASCAAGIDLAASGLRVPSPFDAERGQGTAATRLWVSEAKAPMLEQQLRTRPMVAVARLTRGGRLIADRLEPAEQAVR